MSVLLDPERTRSRDRAAFSPWAVAAAANEVKLFTDMWREFPGEERFAALRASAVGHLERVQRREALELRRVADHLRRGRLPVVLWAGRPLRRARDRRRSAVRAVATGSRGDPSRGGSSEGERHGRGDRRGVVGAAYRARA